MRKVYENYIVAKLPKLEDTIRLDKLPAKKELISLWDMGIRKVIFKGKTYDVKYQRKPDTYLMEYVLEERCTIGVNTAFVFGV